MHDRLGTIWSNMLNAGKFLGGYLLHYVNDTSLFGGQSTPHLYSRGLPILPWDHSDLILLFSFRWIFSSMMDPNWLSIISVDESNYRSSSSRVYVSAVSCWSLHNTFLHFQLWRCHSFKCGGVLHWLHRPSNIVLQYSIYPPYALV